MGRKIEKGLNKYMNFNSFGVVGKTKKFFDPKLPTPPETPVAPVVDDEAAQITNRRKMAKRSQKGRAGTVLTQSDTLG